MAEGTLAAGIGGRVRAARNHMTDARAGARGALAAAFQRLELPLRSPPDEVVETSAPRINLPRVRR